METIKRQWNILTMLRVGGFIGFLSFLELCRETFQDDADVTEEQINEELAPIRAQRGYILQQQYEIETASEIYHTILRERHV